MTIGESIRQARKAKGWTIQKLAEKSGVCFATIWYWERDKATPSIILLTCIADALDISLDDLVGRRWKKNGGK